MLEGASKRSSMAPCSAHGQIGRGTRTVNRDQAPQGLLDETLRKVLSPSRVAPARERLSGSYLSSFSTRYPMFGASSWAA